MQQFKGLIITSGGPARCSRQGTDRSLVVSVRAIKSNYRCDEEDFLSSDFQMRFIASKLMKFWTV